MIRYLLTGYGRRMGFWIFAALISATVAAGSSLGFASTSAAQATGDIGHRDFAYGASVGAPSGEKPQSKLWFNDGIWWGSLFNSSVEEHHIYRFDWVAQTWSDTGTPIDVRNSSKADILWNGEHLYVATATPSSTTADRNAYVRRYSYDVATKSYTLDQGFTANVAPGPIEAIVLDQDSTGKLWVTYTQGNQVYVNHSLSDDATWGTPFVLPVPGTSVTPDDISAVTAFDSKIGVMWSNQNDGTMYFATHNDGDPDDAWRGSVAARCGGCADDHISLKSVQADPSGRVFAAVKTSLNDGATPDPNAPLIWLLVLDSDGNWKQPVVFGRVRDDHTRPIVAVDQTNRKLYVFATAPCCDGGTIYYKQAALSDNISFPEGRGTPFIQSSTDTHINNATSAKPSLVNGTGLLVLASDDTSKYYWHNTLDLTGTVAPNVTLTAPDDGATVSGGVTLSADVSRDMTVDRVEFLANGTLVGTDREAPYSVSWDSTGAADGQATIAARAVDILGTDATSTSRTVTVDNTAPTVNAPSKAMVSPGAVGLNDQPQVPVKISWSGSDSGSGIAGYEVEQSTDNGQYNPVSLPSATDTSVTLQHRVPGSYRYRVRAKDKAGNTSDWAYGPAFTIKDAGGAGPKVSYTGNWSTLKSPAESWGDYYSHSTAKGATAKLTFTGSEVVWVSNKRVNRGKAEVWVDGVKEATVDLYSATSQYQQAVFRKEWPSSGTHTVEVRVLKTKNPSATGTLVAVDEFLFAY